MDSKKIFDAIDDCDDVFIKEVILDMKKKEKQTVLRRIFFNKKQRLSGVRIAAVIVLFILFLGVGVKTTAHISVIFHDWIENVFQKNNITQIILDSKVVNMGNDKVSLETDMQMTGQNETFLYETSYDGIEEKVEKVFSIEGKKQKVLLKKKFKGRYKHLEIAFEYSTIENEIFAYNMHGAVEKVFPVMQKDIVYAVLETSAEEYTQGNKQRGKRLIAIDLKTGEIQSELASKKIIDFVMAENGRYVLVKYNFIQSGGSVKKKWTVFDLQTKEEKNLEKLENTNLEIDEGNFIDDTHIAVGGKINGKGDYETLYYIDISTGKTKEYMAYGNVTPEWKCNYNKKKKTAKFQNLITGEEFLVKNIQVDPSYSTSYYKGYFLIWNEEDLPAYIYNIKKKIVLRLNPPEDLCYTLSVYFSQKENKLLFTNEKEVYLVSIGE